MSPGGGDGDLIRAAFPPGSVTGAPKVRALEIIDELETTSREAYTGAIGYRSPVAGLELNVAIRTFEFAPGKAWLGAGGGIVADSDPADEYAECLIKATPLLKAVGAQLDAGAPARSTEATGRALLLPRPAAGVFTSLLVTDGATRDLAAHLARLEASVRDLYGKGLPANLREELARCLAAGSSAGSSGRGPSGRLRITVRPVGGPLQAAVEVVPLSLPAATGITLRPATVPGGIGAHKYRDRRLLAELATQAGTGPDQHLLLTDETGELLETDRANVFAVIDGVLLTPPADGRLLPGTTRAAVLRAARDRGILTGQKPLTLSELAEATEVFVSNAVAGVLPVTAIGNRTWPPGPVTADLAAALAACRTDSPLARGATGPLTTGPLTTGPLTTGPLTTGPLTTGPFTIGGGTAVLGHGATSGPPRPLVVLIDNYDSFTWNLAHLLDTAGARVEVVRNDEVTASQVVAAAPAGVVISPGPCAPAEAGISIAAVTACAEAGVPLLGICLGHQAIGAAFGARVIRAPSPVHGKAFPVTHDGHGVLAGLPDPFQATRYHSLIVDEATLAPALLVTARTDGIPMAIRHRTRPVEGVQFHPESILTTHGSAIIASFVAAAVRARAGRPEGSR
jgi:para-aminobenzoate synthetase/4-amino-4-deoxychorismate lyase